MNKKVMIYSNEQRKWWAKNYCGYTGSQEYAGVFDYDDVKKNYSYLDYDTTKEDFLVDVEYSENNKNKMALDLIKTKKIPVDIFFNSFKSVNPFTRYNDSVNSQSELTKEEFDLLSEVLKNE